MALATGCVASHATLTMAADWSTVAAQTGSQTGETVVADGLVPTSALPIQHGGLVIGDDGDALLPNTVPSEFRLGESGPSAVQSASDPGVMTHGSTWSEEPTNYVDDEPLTGHIVSDGLCRPAGHCPRWTAQIDALLLWQTNIPSRPLYVDSITNQTVLNANQAIPPVSAAPRYALLYHRDPCRAFEINYFQIQSFAGSAAVGPGANGYAGFDLPGIAFADIVAAQVDTSAGLKSWEFNLRRNQGGIVTWIGGFRWVEWNQQFNLVGTLPGDTLGNDQYLVRTGNNLYGGQFGADMLLWNAHRNVKVNGLAKGGVYYNYQAYQTTTLAGGQAIAPPASSTLGASKDAVAFVGEVALTGEYKLAEWLSWRAGYTLFWLGGIATPTSQLSLSDFTAQTTSVNTYSSAFLHGVTTGLEARW